jgi:hypothetical protein
MKRLLFYFIFLLSSNSLILSMEDPNKEKTIEFHQDLLDDYGPFTTIDTEAGPRTVQVFPSIRPDQNPYLSPEYTPLNFTSYEHNSTPSLQSHDKQFRNRSPYDSQMSDEFLHRLSPQPDRTVQNTTPNLSEYRSQSEKEENTLDLSNPESLTIQYGDFTVRYPDLLEASKAVQKNKSEDQESTKQQEELIENNPQSSYSQSSETSDNPKLREDSFHCFYYSFIFINNCTYCTC